MYDDDEIEYGQEACRIGGHEFLITTVEFLPIEKLMEMHAQDKEISGRKIWCGSLVVAEYLTRNPAFVAAHHVVELGAGTGLLGMLSSRLGARNVYLTDHDTKSLDHMRADCTTNGIAAHVERLDWFDPDLSLLQSVVDLRVIAGDVLYKDTLLAPFMRTTSALLKQRGARMLLCHVPRAGVTHELVLEAASRVGVLAERVAREAWTGESLALHCSEEEIASAQLYQLRR